MQKFLSILSVLLIIGGFSILHNKNTLLESIGSALIGLGALYFIVLLIITQKRQPKSDQ